MSEARSGELRCSDRTDFVGHHRPLAYAFCDRQRVSSVARPRRRGRVARACHELLEGGGPGGTELLGLHLSQLAPSAAYTGSSSLMPLRPGPVNRCTRCGLLQKEFMKVARLTGVGFLAVGLIGFIVKVIFIPINQVSAEHKGLAGRWWVNQMPTAGTTLATHAAAPPLPSDHHRHDRQQLSARSGALQQLRTCGTGQRGLEQLAAPPPQPDAPTHASALPCGMLHSHAPLTCPLRPA